MANWQHYEPHTTGLTCVPESDRRSQRWSRALDLCSAGCLLLCRSLMSHPSPSSQHLDQMSGKISICDD